MIAVVVMFFSFDVSLTELWEYITKAGYWLAAILGLWCVLYLMNAWAWRVIIQGGGPCTVGFMQFVEIDGFRFCVELCHSGRTGWAERLTVLWSFQNTSVCNGLLPP